MAVKAKNDEMSALHGFKVCDEAARTDIESLKSNKAETTHKHTAGDINGGTIPVQYGGTGRSVHAEHSVLVAGTSDQTFINNVQAQKGAFYAKSNVENPLFGTLPADMGGTGNTSLQATRNAMGLGNTTGALPIANGGTGATTAANALGMLGASPVGHGHNRIESSNCSIELGEGVVKGEGTINVEADTILINGREYNKNQIMWEGALYFNADQIHEFINDQTVNAQPNGIVLVFSYYIPDAAESMRVQDDGWSTHFVPKSVTVKDNGENIGGAHTFLMVFNDLQNIYFGMKQLYINNHQISGHLWNDTAVRSSGSLNNGSGITFDNDRFVLRYVIGV